MLKIPSYKSVMLSIALSVLVFVVIAVGALLMPFLAEVYLTQKFGTVVASYFIAVVVLGYLCIAVIAAADIMLLRLLLRVKLGLVFTEKSVALIRGISWCAILLGCVLFLLGFYFLIAFLVSFACLFLGLCVRVVKNVLELATKIKAEYDYTI